MRKNESKKYSVIKLIRLRRENVSSRLFFSKKVVWTYVFETTISIVKFVPEGYTLTGR